MTNDEDSIAEETPPKRGDWPYFHEHSLMEAAVAEAARELQVPREMAMMSAFGAMATACQGHIDVKMPTGHLVPTSLMLLTIAESGERKTTTQNHFFEAINTANNAAYERNKKALIEHRVEHQLWTTRKRQLEQMYNKCAVRKDKDETLVAQRNLEEQIRNEPKIPPSGKFLYEDTTPQALVQMLYENSPNGCLMTSEANSIFSGKALGELDKLNTIWDGGSVIVDRVSREGFILQDARLSLSLMVQPSVVARFMGKRGEEARGTGFLARFLVVKPYSMAGQRIDRQRSQLPRKQAFNNRIRERIDRSTSLPRQVLSFSEAATNYWYTYSQYIEMQMQENGLYYHLKDHASKLLENTSRLSAILHTFERTSESNIEIEQDTLKFCWEYTRRCSKYFIDHIANEPQIVTDTNQLVNYLLKKSAKESENSREKIPSTSHESLILGTTTWFTLTDIKQYGPSCLRGRANADRLTAVVDLLTKLGHIMKTGGRYKFSESILTKTRGTTLRNGEFITIKALPLFTEQVRDKPTHYDKFPSDNYFIIVDS